MLKRGKFFTELELSVSLEDLAENYQRKILNLFKRDSENCLIATDQPFKYQISGKVMNF